MKITVVSAVWCNACLVMKKVIKNLEKEYKNIDFVKYDYDIDEDFVKKLNVGSVLPVFIFENNGKEIRVTGEKTEKELIKIIEGMM